MKFLSSSPSSSTSSTVTTTSFTSINEYSYTPKIREILESQESNIRPTNWSIFGVFRGLFCRNSLPTYPSDHHFKLQNQIDSSSAAENVKQLHCDETENEVEASTTTPNVIARLMGLESLPPSPMPMNSVDSPKEICPRSLQEIPKFLVQEDENFFILSFEKGYKDMKSKMGSEERKQSRGEKGTSRRKSKRRENLCDGNKENQNGSFTASIEKKFDKKVMNSRESLVQETASDIKLKDLSNILDRISGMELKKLEKGDDFHEKEKRIIREVGCLQENRKDAENGGENCSPNSVLDSNIFFPCYTHVSSSGEPSRLSNSKSRRTLTQEIQDYRKLNLGENKSLTSKSTTSNKHDNTKGKVAQLRKNGCKNWRCLKVWIDIEEFVGKGSATSIWTRREIQELQVLKEEISGEIGMEILDQLLREVVDQLVEFYHISS